MKHRSAWLGFVIASCGLTMSPALAAERPNIVVVLVDDLGFSDIGPYGGEVPTPNLDRLAARGIRFTQAYNAARCSPTRASLLTGLYPHDPEKAKALLKEAGVTTPLDLTLILPPPAYARQGGEIIAAQLAEVGINAKIQNVEWAQWLSGVYKDKNFDLTIISHVEPLDIGIYANPNYYFQYDSQAFRDIYAKVTSAPDVDALKAALGDAQKKIAEDSVNGFLFAYPNVTVADAGLKGLWKNAPLSATDLAAMSWK